MDETPVDLERERNIKQRGPLGALLETSADRGPDEVQVLGQMHQLMRQFSYADQMRMLNWLEARCADDEDTRQRAAWGEPPDARVLGQPTKREGE